jgi:hypothetical protein
VKGSKIIERNLAGTLANGFKFRAVRWSRERCECGQMLNVRTYLPALADDSIAD